MIDALSIANSGLTANHNWINTISNNIANMQTVGYKRGESGFQDLVGMGISHNQGIGVSASAPINMFSDGQVKSTGQSYDLAIRGAGFFEVEQADGQLKYTRVGQFHVNSDGKLALHNGDILMSDINIPPDVEKVKVSTDGQVTGVVIGTGEQLELGKIQLAFFQAPQFLEQVGQGQYIKSPKSGDAFYDPSDAGVKGGSMLQGQLELSNVDLVSEMGNLVMAQRAYQMNARILQASDQIMETINNLRR